MNPHVRPILSIVAAGVWINASEFFRNQMLLHDAWISHYSALGMTFPEAPVNGAVWGLWGFLYASVIQAFSTRFSLVQTTVLAWVIGFVMMWMVSWNLGVFPVGILTAAVPLSMLEAFVAAAICHRLRVSASHA
jgi:ABC-type multidrug transport system fused ATPase/permease subunit